MLFSALRFVSDANISDRIYWYLAPIPLAAGESVFAPVGAHNRLQFARVERVLNADKDDAPYDLAQIKKIEARAQERVLSLGGVSARDLGGILYDDRHYTHFYRIAFAEEGLAKTANGLLKDEGFGSVLHVLQDGEAQSEALAGEGSAVLITGRGAREYARKIILAARGKEHELQYIKLARLLT